jgi:uncharacterized membrane protein
MFKIQSALMLSVISAVAYYIYISALAQKKGSFAQKLGVVLASVIGLIALAFAVKYLYCVVDCYFFGGCQFGR